PNQTSAFGAWPSVCFQGWKWSLTNTESKPTCSASTENDSSFEGANCSSYALYPSLSTMLLLDCGRHATAGPGGLQPALAARASRISSRRTPCASSTAADQWMR